MPVAMRVQGYYINNPPGRNEKKNVAPDILPDYRLVVYVRKWAFR